MKTSVLFRNCCTAAWFISSVESHGYLSSPRSRNWFAREDGIDSGSLAGRPSREYCPHCLNTNPDNGVCGFSNENGGVSYDDWLDSTGSPMPWISQSTFAAGDTIVVDTTLTAHHGGHMELSGCPLGRASTQACFDDDKHKFIFVKDMLYDMPADPSYEERGYYYGGQASSVKDFSMQFRVPEYLVGEQVLLQWRYITANTCSPAGYSNYFNGANSQSRVLPVDFWNPQVSECQLPYPQDGTVSGIWPEQFFNCAEVTIEASQPSVPVPTAPSPTAPVPSPTVPAPSPTVPAPTASQPTSPDAPASPPSQPSTLPKEDSRLIAYLGNWQSCPTAEQLSQYTHVVIAFAVSYVWTPAKNECSQTCDIATPPICNNQFNPVLVSDLQAAGKKVLLSFGGAGMGGSWASSVDDCWDHCFGREEQVVDRLVEIVEELSLDGVDLDYEYYYEDNQNGSGFAKGAEAQTFLRDVTLGLREKLPQGAIVTHAPMDPDLLPGTAYFNILESVSSTLDFLMPQYYNGITRPVIDGIAGAAPGRISSLTHYRTLVDTFFQGDATKMVFGFCISDCSGTGSNANGPEAAKVMVDLAQEYGCNGGAFFWVAEHDIGGAWSQSVSQVTQGTAGCSSSPQSPSAPLPTAPQPTAPEPTAPTPTAPQPTAPEPTVVAPTPTVPQPTVPEPTPTAPQPTVPEAPVSAPSPAPATGSPPMSSEGCCSLDFKECIDWCGTTEEDCASCDVTQVHAWLPDGRVTNTCVARWGTCTNDPDGCCLGLVCHERSPTYSQCEVP